MRAILISVLAFGICAVGLSAAEGEGNFPFAGWGEDQIEKHRKKAASAIKSRMGKWLKSRKGMTEKCRNCRGKGKTKTGRQYQPCLNCRGTGVRIDREKFVRSFWDYNSPNFRGDARRRLAMNKRYSEAKKDPVTASATLQEITGSKVIGVEVKGNFAIATFEEKLGKEKFKRRIEWVEMDGDWWMADPVADRTFARSLYTGLVQKPVAAAPKKPDATPPATKPGGKSPPDPVPVKPTKERKPLEDPDTLFRMGEVNVKHVEENAYKVFGQVANKTEDRRFAYILVEVSFFKGEKMVDTVTCNVGTVILKPGRVASFVGYLYSDAKPSYDRVEAKVAKYEQMD